MAATAPYVSTTWQPFRCDVEPHRDVVRLVLTGDFELASAPEVAGALLELREVGFEAIELDLHRVTFVDSSAVRLILQADDAARAAGHRFTIVPGPPPVQRVFELCGLVDRLSFCRPRRVERRFTAVATPVGSIAPSR